MGTWGTKTFESDDAFDFIAGIYDEHKNEKGKDDFLFKDLKNYLKEISTSEFLEQEDSIGVEVSAYIFSELINYDEKRIKKSLKDLEEELQEECEGGYKLDLTKDIYKIIQEVEEKDGFIPAEMYVDLCLYKNKNYNIGETFLYKLIEQLNNVISGNSENYENWEGNEEWLDENKKIFEKLKNGLKDEQNIKEIELIISSFNKNIKTNEKNLFKIILNKITNFSKSLKKDKIYFKRDGLEGYKYFDDNGNLFRLELSKFNSDIKENFKIEEWYKNEDIIKKTISKGRYIVKTERFKDGKKCFEKRHNLKFYDGDL